jgi:hypothetical protein
VIRRLLTAWAILAVLLGGAAAGVDKDPFDLTPVINAFRFDGVETRVTWETCGEINAYYFPSQRKVVLCTELQAFSPGVVRYILAHELSHAVIMQRDVAYTTSHEGAADELAALVLIWMGRDTDVLEGARFWATLGRPENPFDDHFGDVRRAWNMTCLVAGSRDDGIYSRGCTETYRRAVRAWVRLLELR